MSSSSYLDKVFQTPEYIWQNGVCNLDLLERTLIEQSQPRLALLAQDAAPLPDISEPEQAQVTAKPTEPDPLDSISTEFKAEMPQPTSGHLEAQSATRSAVVPLATDVWTSEPINYVCTRSFIREDSLHLLLSTARSVQDRNSS